jgi:hypothetical protein
MRGVEPAEGPGEARKGRVALPKRRVAVRGRFAQVGERGLPLGGVLAYHRGVMSEDSKTKERRRAVRLRPIEDLPAEARLVDQDMKLEVWDVSVGGLAVVDPKTNAGWDPDTQHRIHLDLGRYGAFDLDVLVRHRTENVTGTVGMQLVDPPHDVTVAMGRYVAELLERGAFS